MNYSPINNLQTQHRVRSIFENPKHLYICTEAATPRRSLKKKLFQNLKYEQYIVVLPKYSKNTCQGAQFQQSCRPKAYRLTE